MTDHQPNTVQASLRATLSGDRVVRESLRHALEITGCSIAFLHAGVDNMHLCVARRRDDPVGRIRRATMFTHADPSPAVQARSNVDAFPLSVPRDLFDPTRVRAYASAPLPSASGLSGGLVCLDERSRPFTRAELDDLEALAFTLGGRLVPSGETDLGTRLRSLHRELEPVSGLLRHSERLAGRWRELGHAIDLAATKLGSV